MKLHFRLWHLFAIITLSGVGVWMFQVLPLTLVVVPAFLFFVLQFVWVLVENNSN